MNALPGSKGQTSRQGTSASSAGPTERVKHDQQSGSSQEPSFLKFLHLVEQYEVPIVDPRIADAQQRSNEAVGTLGKGGQFVVDRTYGNQRYPEQRGLAAETNMVYKRIIWSMQHERSDTIHQNSQLEAFVNEVRVLGHLRSSPNIIDLIGVAWEQDSYGQISPVLALGYAQHNSLDRFLADNAHTVTFREKRRLVQDVACGVFHIHGADFVWGDCKPGNVLICQHAYDRTSITAKISDFGLSIAGTSEQAKFSGISMPWISKEARDAVGMTALRQSEMYSLGLVIWSILLSGKQFQKDQWAVDQPPTTGQDGRVSSEQIVDLTCAGKLQDIACRSIESRLRSVISEIEIQTFSAVLYKCLSFEPHLRMSAKELYNAVRQGTAELFESGTRYKDDHKEFDMEWLMSNFGPNTRLHAVGTKVFRHLEKLSYDGGSAATEFQLGICYATGFGGKRDLQLACVHMSNAEAFGHSEAHGLRKRLAKIAKDFEDYPETASRSKLSPSMDAMDAHESDIDDHSSDSPKSVKQYRTSDLSTIQVKSGSKGKRKAGADASIQAAIAQGDLHAVEACMSQPDFSIHQKNEQQESLLMCAMLRGQPEIFQMLLEYAKADPRVTDQQNRTILHALPTLKGSSCSKMITVFKDNTVLLGDCLKDSVSIVAVPSKSAAAAGARPGTPLEWAVDARNTAAVRFLLYLGSDPSVSKSGWSALHRAASRHDCEMLGMLLGSIATEALMRYDHSGRSPLACAVADIHAFDRLLISKGNRDLLEPTIRKFRSEGHNLKRLDIATESGESVVYHALRSNKLDPHVLSAFWDWNWERPDRNFVPGPTGPNRWSPFRRVLYCSNTAPFELMCFGLGREPFVQALELVSPDRLTIFHELAFLPMETALIIIHMISNRAEQLGVRLQLKRMQPHGSRPSLTPFQLAVLCGNTVLAQTYVEKNLENPLEGLDKSRFLAFVIEYPAKDPYTLSTWLSLIRDDPIVEATRRFPHPTSMSEPLKYLLEHDEEWWQAAKNQTGYWKCAILGQSPSFDKDAEHDPFLSWTPNLMTSLQFDEEGEQPAAVVRYGADRVLDNNVFGLGHRLRHTLDYGSFLLRSNPDVQAHNQNGHPYVTALELGLSVALKSDYKEHAKQNFNTMLRFFGKPTHCNFPYYQYLPTGRMRVEYLRRRETILHRAVRHREYELVRSIIAADADIHMANNTWQTPLRLAKLIVDNKNPDEYSYRGTFLARLGPDLAPAVLSDVSPSATPSEKILGALEEETVKTRRPWWSLPRLRALREVKWPWDEYETDELGLRFVLFYLAVLVIILGTLTLISRLLSFIPFILFEFTPVAKQWVHDLENLRMCFLNGTRNGTSQREPCRLDRWTLAPIDIQIVVPAVEHRLQSILDALDDCYDGSGNASLPGPIGSLDDDPFLPGCPPLNKVCKNDRVVDATIAVNRAVYKFLEEECKCRCSWFNEPSTGFEKTIDLG